MGRPINALAGQAEPARYLAALNAEQRRAVEHGGPAAEACPPLLIIAGAGSGKTNTLAHRVAHLIASGPDPRLMLPPTLPLRAACGMPPRLARLPARVAV